MSCLVKCIRYYNFGGVGIWGQTPPPPLALVWGVWSPMRPTEIGKSFEIVT